MQIVLALALSITYVGLALRFGGVHPANGFPWWFFAPGMVAFGAALAGEAVAFFLPTRWMNGQPYRPPPRPVHLSWRTAVRVPPIVPVFIIPYHFYWIMRFHFDIGWVMHFVIVPLIAILLVIQVLRLRREIRLLREGDTATAVIDWHSQMGEGPERVNYHFDLADGTTVPGRGWDVGYRLYDGSDVPVFYDANNPMDQVVACGCWFEAD